MGYSFFQKRPVAEALHGAGGNPLAYLRPRQGRRVSRAERNQFLRQLCHLKSIAGLGKCLDIATARVPFAARIN